MLGARRLSLGAGVGLGQRPDAKLAHLGDVGGAELAHGTDNPTDAIEHQLIFKTGGMLRRQGQSVHASALGSGGKRVAQQGCRFETQRLHLLAASGKLFRVTRLPLGQALFQQPQIRLRWLLLHPYHGLTHRLEALAWQIDGELACWRRVESMKPLSPLLSSWKAKPAVSGTATPVLAPGGPAGPYRHSPRPGSGLPVCGRPGPAVRSSPLLDARR